MFTVNEESYVLDVALLLEDRRVDIEVDGDEHLDARGRSRRKDLARDRVLAGLGWQVVRIPAWRCLREARMVAAEIASIVVEHQGDRTRHTVEKPLVVSRSPRTTRSGASS